MNLAKRKRGTGYRRWPVGRVLFVGLFGSVLVGVPAHLGGVGGGVLVTLRQSGLGLGVATLDYLYLYLALRLHDDRHAFVAVECIWADVVGLSAVGAAILPRFTEASAGIFVIEG
jgi:hypothetical protein